MTIDDRTCRANSGFHRFQFIISKFWQRISAPSRFDAVLMGGIGELTKLGREPIVRDGRVATPADPWRTL